MEIIENINKDRIPKHVAIIMDGNGRWAKSKNKIRLSGHQAGAKSVRNAIEICVELGIKYLTVYAFSTENWNRPNVEVKGLMQLLVKSIDKELDELKNNGVKVSVIGETNKLPEKVKEKIDFAVKSTKDNDKLNFIIALSYSGRWDIVNAAKRIINDAKDNKIDSNNFNDNDFASYLSTDGIPDPELLIRTSGEERISNFLLYQIAYSELYFTHVLWPDFSKEEFCKAILNYQNRERRFGKTIDQLKN